jgi:HEAT repeat protein
VVGSTSEWGDIEGGLCSVKHAAMGVGKIMSDSVRRCAISAAVLLAATAMFFAGWPADGRADEQAPPSIDGLLAALHSADRLVRIKATEALGRTKDPRAVEPLISALKDSDPLVRGKAARALGLIHDGRAIDPLIAAMQDPEHLAGLLVVDAVGDFRDPRAIAPLIALLDAGPDYDYLGTEVADALRKIGAPAADALLTALKDNNSRIRSGAAAVWGTFDPPVGMAPRAAEALAAMLEDGDKNASAAAAWALGNNRKLEAEAAVAAELKNADAVVRQSAAEILGEIQDPRAIDPLTAALDDPDATVRQNAGEALRSIKIARADAPPPADDVPYRVVSNIDLTEPFHTASKWSLVIFEAPDTCYGDEGCNGPYQFCLVHAGQSTCSQAGGAVLVEAEVVLTPRRPLLVTVTHPDVFTSGSGMYSTDVQSYNAEKDAFSLVFSNTISVNNNEETRIITSGPLAGDIAVSQEPTGRPYHYSIHLYGFSKAGKYAETLHFTGGTVYGDGNPLAVIDSEMPELLRRLHLWKPSEPPPVPPVMPQRCSALEMRGRTEWCR